MNIETEKRIKELIERREKILYAMFVINKLICEETELLKANILRMQLSEGLNVIERLTNEIDGIQHE
jgi:hypothetical protein